MKNIYIFSGLATDERIFQKFSLPGHHVKFIKWITPLKGEKIDDYAKRLSAQIHDSEPILIGLSFGGMIAIETAKFYPSEKVILISSAKSRAEVPFYYRMAGILGLDKIMPSAFFKKADFMIYWFFGAKTIEEKKLLRSIMRDADIRLLRWSVHQVINWKSTSRSANLFHIHGTADRIFPYCLVKAGKPVLHGTHFMIYDRAGEIEDFILQEIHKNQE